MDELRRFFQELQYVRSGTVGDFQSKPPALAQDVRRPGDNQTVEGEPVRPAVECERGVEAADFGLKGTQIAGGDIGGI